MQVEDIALSRQTDVKLRMRGIVNNFTREARGGQEKYWQEKLAALDPELVLRWSYLSNQWVVYYDHRGLITCITTFKRPCDFGKVYQNLRVNAYLDSRMLHQMKKKWDESVNREQDQKINDLGDEFGKELHHATRGRVINDGVKNNDY